MTLYSPEGYFKKLYPDWFKETPFSEVIFYVFLFFLLMLAFYLYIRFFENKRREKMLINNIRHEIGDEIDFGSIHGRGRDDYKVMIRKISDAEWIAYKFPFGTEEKVPLRRGDLRKIVDYLNRNFGYNNEVAGYAGEEH